MKQVFFYFTVYLKEVVQLCTVHHKLNSVNVKGQTELKTAINCVSMEKYTICSSLQNSYTILISTNSDEHCNIRFCGHTQGHESKSTERSSDKYASGCALLH